MKRVDYPYPLPEGMYWAVSDADPDEPGAHGKKEGGIGWWFGWVGPLENGKYRVVTHPPHGRPVRYPAVDTKEEALKYLSALLILGEPDE